MTVPVIDLQNFPEAEEYKKLREASEEWGCFRLVNHKVPLTLMSEMKMVIKSLHDLPREIKEQNTHVMFASGYIPRSTFNPLYESLGLYDFGSSDALQTFCSQVHASSYQREVIEKYAQAIYEQIMDLCHKLAESFGLEKSFFKGWPCQFRFNKYHFSPQSVGSSGVRLHSDPGFLTILHDDENVGGLEMMDKSGAFVPVDPCANSLLVNFGDISKAWSNGRLCNVKHRVQCKETSIRLSIAAFLLGPNEESLEAPSEFVDLEHPRLYVPFTFKDYIKLRYSTKSVTDEAEYSTKSATGGALELLRTKS